MYAWNVDGLWEVRMATATKERVLARYCLPLYYLRKKHHSIAYFVATILEPTFKCQSKLNRTLVYS